MRPAFWVVAALIGGMLITIISVGYLSILFPQSPRIITKEFSDTTITCLETRGPFPSISCNWPTWKVEPVAGDPS